ncbi:UNVERIFIED_CONTAM: hypothetical protein GTU68_065198 [Idotea baltica]|nr:hypothetical protein [Idotea baltica]
MDVVYALKRQGRTLYDSEVNSSLLHLANHQMLIYQGPK